MNKKILFGIIALIVVLITGFFLTRPKKAVMDVTEEIPTPSMAFPTISDNVIISLTSKQENKIMVLSIKGMEANTESVEYELTYNTGAGLPRGVLGKIAVDGEREITRDDIVLGTCSSGKCVYDTGVTSVDLSLKFNFQDGSSSVFRKNYELK